MRDRERWLITEQASNFDPKSVQNYLRTLYVCCFFSFCWGCRNMRGSNVRDKPQESLCFLWQAVQHQTVSTVEDPTSRRSKWTSQSWTAQDTMQRSGDTSACFTTAALLMTCSLTARVTCSVRYRPLQTLTKVQELLHGQGRGGELGEPLHLFRYSTDGAIFQQKLSELHVSSPVTSRLEVSVSQGQTVLSSLSTLHCDDSGAEARQRTSNLPLNWHVVTSCPSPSASRSFLPSL